MKKKLLALFTCTILAAALATGCGGGTEPAADDDSNNAAETVVEKNTDPSLPLLEADLVKLYEDAHAIYSDISLGQFEHSEDTYDANGMTYNKIIDDRFETYDEFQAYLEQYFTKDFVSSVILSEDNIMFAKGDDGALYSLIANRGANIFYAGHIFETDRESDKEIDISATVYYANAIYEGEIFHEAPENPDDYKTEKVPFILLNEDGAWKFDEFSIFY